MVSSVSICSSYSSCSSYSIYSFATLSIEIKNRIMCKSTVFRVRQPFGKLFDQNSKHRVGANCSGTKVRIETIAGYSVC